MSLDFFLYGEADTGDVEPVRVDVHHMNLTHNLGHMAQEAGIYDVLWHPDTSGISVAGDLIVVLSHTIKHMRENPTHYEQFNPENGWGSYRHFVPRLEALLEACKKHPKAKIEADR